MFIVPKLPQLKKPRQETTEEQEQDHGLPAFKYSDVKVIRLIGSGGFGKVFLAQYRNKDVVLKELSDAEEKDVVREARFLSKLSHQNLVKLYGVSTQKKALMLEYVFFDLTPFGLDLGVSSLDKLLSELDPYGFKGFEHLISNIANGVISGLKYLHREGVAHRDLKPGNILVDNQHFCSINGDEGKGELWKTHPCVVKLTDFGESWGQLCQTSQNARSHTVNVVKGTPAFMAPEIIDKTRRLNEMNVGQLKRADMWSLCLVLFCLINPSLKVPYFQEGRHASRIGQWNKFLVTKVSNGIVPMGDSSYDRLKATSWANVNDAFISGFKVNPMERPSFDDLDAILKKELESTSYPLCVHQGSALENAQVLKKDELFTSPANDGTNACSFLSLKVCEQVLLKKVVEWQSMADISEEVISCFPLKVNDVRNKGECYDVQGAYKIMLENGLIAKCTLTDKSTGQLVFSEEGRKELMSSIKDMTNAAVITVPPYTFVVGRNLNNFYVVDTHVIGPLLGGNNNGILKVFPDVRSISRWIWSRLSESGVRSELQQFIHFEINVSTSPHSADTTKEEVRHSDAQESPSHLEQNVQEAEKYSIIIESEDEDAVVISDELREISINTGASISSQRDNKHSTPAAGNLASITSERIWNESELSNWGPFAIPFIPSFRRKLKMSEQLALVSSTVVRSQRIPQSCRRNAIFLVDSKVLGDPDDVQSDLNGVYEKCIEVKTYTVKVLSSAPEGKNISVVSRKKISLEEGQLHLRINRKENRSGLVRTIAYFMNMDGEIVNNTILLQYTLNTKICGEATELHFKVPSHGNSNSRSQDSSFYPIKKSTIRNLGDALSGKEKRQASKVYAANLVDLEDGSQKDFGDFPRSKKQVHDLARNVQVSNPENEVELLLAYNEELEEKGIVWYHADIPSDLWVIGNPRMANDLSHAEGGLPISVDPTFNLGAFEVTPFTYRHQLIEAKSKNVRQRWVSATMVGPTIIHHHKSEEVFDMAIRAVATKTSLARKKIGIVTDGEEALINAIRSNFKSHVGLRCTIHFKNNCKDFLKNIGITGDKQAPFLDVVFGDDGLTEAEHMKDLKKRLNDATQVLNDMERAALPGNEDEEPKFSAYLKDRRKSVFKRLIRDARREGGMPVNTDNIPDRVFTNQSETVNSILSSQKLSLGYNKKEDLTKIQFVHNVWEKVVKEQASEIERAIIGQSERYRLTEDALYLRVEVEEWFNWSKDKRRKYLEAFSKMTLQDVNDRKPIRVDDENRDSVQTPPIGNLSVKLTDMFPSLDVIRAIEKKALDLLNTPRAVVNYPSVEEKDDNKKYLVAGSASTPYTVKVSKQSKVSCDCRGFKLLRICSHAVVVAEKESALAELVKSVKIGQRSLITYPNSAGGAGRKGAAKRRQRNYPSCTNAASGIPATPFSEVWHNNEPLILTSVKDVPHGRNKCGYCGNEFPKGVLSIIPFDVVLSHKERWEYLNKNREGPSDPKYLKSALGKETTKYYCIQKNCITKRFPYYRRELVQIPDNVKVTDSHKKLLRQELDLAL